VDVYSTLRLTHL